MESAPNDVHALAEGCRSEGAPFRSERIGALDALRGLAVLGMGLSGMIAFRTLPPWMYHAQEPPPTHDFNAKVLGITWVDLVFPFFLFALGAAVPLALGRRVASGESVGRIALGLLGRGAGLWLFALLSQHLRPWTMAPDFAPLPFGLSVLGFFGLVLLFRRPKRGEPSARRWTLAGAGFLVCAAIAATWTYPGPSGFRWDRADIIIVVLANVAVSTGAIWLVTRRVPLARAVVVGVVAAFFLAATLPVDPASAPPLAKAVWNWHPLPIGYFFQPEYHKYLLITLPGTFAGELLRDNPLDAHPHRARAVVLLLLGLAASGAAVALFLAREVVLAAVIVGAIGAVMAALGDGALRRLAGMGTGLFLAGAIAEPVGIGIRKDPPTLGYFLVGSGLACLLLAGLHAAYVRLRAGRRLGLLEGPGANPILAYAAIAVLVPAAGQLTGFDGVWGTIAERYLGMNPWLVSLSGLFKTLLVAVGCLVATRRGFFLRV